MNTHPCLRPAAVALALAGLVPSLHAMPNTARLDFAPYAAEAGGRTETVSVAVQPLLGGVRQFTLTTTQPQREQTPQQRVVAERTDGPRVQTASPLFDALFAMALDDAKQNSVAAIRDGAYNAGQPIDCECFQTGEKWHYVWTRDLSYAVNLGLAWLDTPRAVNSLRFKTSVFRAGVPLPAGLPAGSLQIVQDTGSGGSWPVSTDRVTWAWGAESALNALAPSQRAAFAEHSWQALRGTLEADRVAAFDPRSGLYGGEQSFLDWRTQTYAPWIVRNLSRMAASKALSTNVSHFQALQLAARLATERGDAALARRYGDWAAALKDAINRVFWLADVQQYASLTSDDATPIALHKFDLLGIALAITSGVAPPERAALALAHYPQGPFGPPVISPQQPGIAVYHNRAMWPFVTAYALRAAAQVGNAAVAAQAFSSLQRGAALNLSNMENLEWLTGKPQFDDGPVINSRRQLWSVAAYLSLVVESVFGVQPVADGLRLAPFLTTTARRALGDGPSATLQGLPLQGHAVSVRLLLPALTSAAGYHPLAEVRLNGRVVAPHISAAQLRDGPNEIELSFGERQDGDGRSLAVATVNPLSRHDARVFAPDAPALGSIQRVGQHLQLRITPPAGADAKALRYSVYRDGRALASDLAELNWQDPEPLADPAVRRSYAVQALHLASGHRSHLSEPVVFDDGAVQHTVLGQPFELVRAGLTGFELLYENRAGSIQTGVTNAVQWLRVLDEQGREVAAGVVQMPHQDETAPPRTGLSTLLRVQLLSGRYRLLLQDYFNMSALQSNASYSGAGGLGGPLNHAEVKAVKVIALPDGG